MNTDEQLQVINAKLDAIHRRLDGVKLTNRSPAEIIAMFNSKIIDLVEAREELGYNSPVKKVRTMEEAIHDEKEEA